MSQIPTITITTSNTSSGLHVEPIYYYGNTTNSFTTTTINPSIYTYNKIIGDYETTTYYYPTFTQPLSITKTEVPDDCLCCGAIGFEPCKEDCPNKE